MFALNFDYSSLPIVNILFCIVFFHTMHHQFFRNFTVFPNLLSRCLKRFSLENLNEKWPNIILVYDNLTASCIDLLKIVVVEV